MNSEKDGNGSLIIIMHNKSREVWVKGLRKL